MQEFSEIRAVLDTLKAEKNRIQDRSTPLRDERDRLLAKIQPTLEKIRALEQQYKAVEHPRLADLDNQIAALARILGAKRMSEGATSSMGV